MEAKQIKFAILKALQEAGGPAGAAKIGQTIAAMGVALQPRTIRLYLYRLDREGLTRFVSRRSGREITPRGRDELAHGNVMDKVGFIAAKIDNLGYQMTFQNRAGKGSIITNLVVLDRSELPRALEIMRPVFARNLGMGTRLAIAHEGQSLAGVKVPRYKVMLGTVCSVTVNGIMLAERIPVLSRFGGLLEMRDGKPMRFVELIEYRGTTVDPLEFFINAGMTRARDCARNGSGLVGASFREIPTAAVSDAQRVHKEMERHGLGGILAIGKPHQHLLDIPVPEGRTGMIVLGGLNPVAAMREGGVRVDIQSLAGLEDYGSFLPYHSWK